MRSTIKERYLEKLIICTENESTHLAQIHCLWLKQPGLSALGNDHDMVHVCLQFVELNSSLFFAGIKLAFSGYSHKMPILVENTVNALMQFTRPDWERYEVLLRQLELKVKNFVSFSPIEQADGYYTSAIFDRSYQHEERVAALERKCGDGMCSSLVEFLPPAPDSRSCDPHQEGIEHV